MKPADELRNATGFDPLGMEDAAQKAAALLDECERALARVTDVFLDVDGKHGPQESAALDEAHATLAKLRGEA